MTVGNAEELAGIDRLVREYAAARSRLEKHREQEKPLAAAKTRAELALFDALENANLSSVRSRELGLFTLDDKASPVIDDAVAFVAWAEKEMPELLIANRQRLGAIVREILRGDRPAIDGGSPDGLPPGIGYTPLRNVSWRRS